MSGEGVTGRDVEGADLTDRNRRIADAYRAGATMTAIAQQHGLSTERVRQLVRRAEGRPPPRSSKAAPVRS